MKNFFMVVIAIVAMVVSANPVFAQDNDVDIDINNSVANTVNATGGNASANQTQEQAQEQEQTQAQEQEAIANNSFTYVSEDKREFLGAPPYPGFVNPGQAEISTEWQVYCPSGLNSFSVEELERMSNTFQFSDIFIWNWEDRVKVTPIGKPLPAKSRDAQSFCMNYWPAEKPLAIVRVMGEAGWSEESFRAKASLECFNEYNSVRVPVRFRNHKDSVTKGRSLGLGGAASQVSGATGIVGAVGGQIGDNRVVAEEYPEFEALCLGDAPAVVRQTTQKVVEKEVVYIERPAPEPSCDASTIYKRLEQLIEGTKHCCKDECLNNLLLWKQIGDAYLDLFHCTGDRKFLTGTGAKFPDGAITAYARAEKNFLEGKEPDGTKTRNLKGAQEIVYNARYNWAWAIYNLYGAEKAVEFGSAKKLDRVPEFYQELKR